MIVHYKNGIKDFTGMNNIITPICISVEVERQLNGYFIATVLILKDYDLKFKEIKAEDILKIHTPNGPQLFRIKDVDDTGKHCIELSCKHIFFDLENRMIWDTFIQQRNGAQALQQILNNLDKETDFTAFSDISMLNNLRLVRTKGVSSILGGKNDNYLLERYNGELDLDNFKIKLLKRLGTDRGYQIREGKNMTGFDYKESTAEIVTRLAPILFDGITLPEKYVDSPLINEYEDIYTETIKFDDIKLKDKEDEEGYNTKEEMFEEARKRCLEIFENERLDRIKVNCTVNFIDVSKTEQYKDLQFLHRIDLGDTVEFIVESYNVTAKERVISYKYDALREEYIEIEIGREEKGIFSTLDNIGSELEGVAKEENVSTKFDKWYEKVIADVTNQIHTGMKDSYVLVRKNEILIMDTEDITTAQSIWRWNRGGLGHSKDGYNGTYSTAMTAEGQFVINEITCKRFMGNLIEAGTIHADRLSVEAKKTLRDGLVLETDFNVKFDGIIGTVSEKLASGETIKSASMELNSDGFHTTSGGIKASISKGVLTIRDIKGYKIAEINRNLQLFNSTDGNTSDFCGGLRSSIIKAENTHGIELVMDDGEDYMIFSITQGDGGISDSSTTWLKCNRTGNVHFYKNLDLHDRGLFSTHINQDKVDTCFIGNLALRSNQINTNYSSGNLHLNYWRGYNATSFPAKTYVGQGNNDGSRGILYCKSIDTKEATIQEQNTRIGTKASYGVTALDDFIEDMYFAKVKDDGTCIIALDHNFIAQANTEMEYHVQVTGYEGSNFKIERFSTHIKLTGGIVNEEASVVVKARTRNQEYIRYRNIIEDTELNSWGMENVLKGQLQEKEDSENSLYKLLKETVEKNSYKKYKKNISYANEIKSNLK